MCSENDLFADPFIMGDTGKLGKILSSLVTNRMRAWKVLGRSCFKRIILTSEVLFAVL